MHNECNHACLQQPIYPSYIPPYPSLPSSLHPSYLFPSTLSPSFFLPYSLSHSHCTPPYPPKETILPHTILLNKVVENTYNIELSRIPVQSNDVLKIDKSTLECIDAYKRCDFSLIKLEEQYYLLNYNQLCSSFPLSEFQIPTNEPILQITSILINGLMSMCVNINHALSNFKPYEFHIPQMCCQIIQDLYFITFVLIHIDLWRPMVKIHIPHILVDLGPIID